MDLDRATQRADAIADVGEPGSQRPRSWIEPDAIIQHLEQQRSTLFSEQYVGFRARAGIFCGVLERFDAGKIDGGLQARWVAGNPIGLDVRWNGGPTASGLKRPPQALLAEQRWINPVRQRPHLVDGALYVVMQLIKELARPRGIAIQCGAGELRLDGQRDELLLGSVVQIALDSPALVVARLDNAGPRGLQFRGALSKFLERGFQRGIQL